jgi:hypothetical protein
MSLPKIPCLAIPYLAASLMILVGLCGVASAQSGVVTTPIAPGAAAPPSGLPGIGAGNVEVAPGSAARGVPTEQISPGGTVLAPATTGIGNTPHGIPVVPGMRRR